MLITLLDTSSTYANQPDVLTEDQLNESYRNRLGLDPGMECTMTANPEARRKRLDKEDIEDIKRVAGEIYEDRPLIRTESKMEKLVKPIGYKPVNIDNKLQ